jgi:hypothetical protein
LHEYKGKDTVRGTSIIDNKKPHFTYRENIQDEFIKLNKEKALTKIMQKTFKPNIKKK